MFWTDYAFNAMAYDAKEGDQVHRNLDQDIVLNLLRLYYVAGRDVCKDNFFTSHCLDKLLLKQNFGSNRSYCWEMAKVIAQKIKLYSSKFTFKHNDGICLVAYQGQRKQKPVLMFSLTHVHCSASNEETKNLA